MTVFGTIQQHFLECGSTNDIARQWADHPIFPAPSGARVTAEFQTAGRGQRGRQWQAGPGESALMSFVYRLPGSAELNQLGLVTALAVAEALELFVSVPPKIKWPNDILLDGRKAAGILVEAFGRTAILGIGINVNQEQFEHAHEFVYPPTSLRLASGRAHLVSEVIEAVSHALTRWAETGQRDGFDPVLTACRVRLAAGAVVRQGSRQAELIGLTDSGAAQVCLPDGTFMEWGTVN